MIEIPHPVRVEKNRLLPSPDIIPNEHSDWADTHSSTILKMREEFIFDVTGIAHLDSTYDYDYYIGADVSVASIKRMQESVGWLEHRFEADEEGIDVFSDGKYSLESRIEALAHTMLRDGYTHALNMVDSKQDIRIEYAKDKNKYIIQIFWKR
jgi:hypothetical protein